MRLIPDSYGTTHFIVRGHQPEQIDSAHIYVVERSDVGVSTNPGVFVGAKNGVYKFTAFDIDKKVSLIEEGSGYRLAWVLKIPFITKDKTTDKFAVCFLPFKGADVTERVAIEDTFEDRMEAQAYIDEIEMVVSTIDRDDDMFAPDDGTFFIVEIGANI